MIKLDNCVKTLNVGKISCYFVLSLGVLAVDAVRII